MIQLKTNHFYDKILLVINVKVLNITAGNKLNKILEKPNELFIPFNEAMNKGKIEGELFSAKFIERRSIVHGVTTEFYKNNLSLFLSVIDKLNEFEIINLWFGDDDFCKKNMLVILALLDMKKYVGDVYLIIVDELTGKRKNKTKVQVSGYFDKLINL